jgi:hypothetical protein
MIGGIIHPDFILVGPAAVPPSPLPRKVDNHIADRDHDDDHPVHVLAPY